MTQADGRAGARPPPAGGGAGTGPDTPPGLRLSDFEFELPKDRIALRPARPRDRARLLAVGPDGSLRDHLVRDLPDLLTPGDLLVFNDTRVVPARLAGVRERAALKARIAANLLRRVDASRWTALMKPGKRVQPGDRVRFLKPGAPEALVAEVEGRDAGGVFTLAFDRSGARLDAALEATGAPPLPPYIEAQRPGDAQDVEDYQTLFARADGSVAAPTAGLHFTPELMARLADAGVACAFVTLHVGAGTFLPVKSEVVSEHRMHAEWGEVSAETARKIADVRTAGGRVVAVGTTSLRLLESAARETGGIAPFCGETDIFIRPGFEFRVADLLVTNFHLPRSTLLILLAAFSGLKTVRAGYAHALSAGYRFYSYGDAGLWTRTTS